MHAFRCVRNNISITHWVILTDTRVSLTTTNISTLDCIILPLLHIEDTYWRDGAMGKEFELAISRSQVQILLEAALRNNLRQVVHTYVPLSPSSITWYRPKGGDALWLGR